MKNYFRKQLFQSVFYPFIFTLLMWLVFLLQQSSPDAFIRWGVLPRTISGLKGVVSSVFIHHDVQHVFSNTVPLLVLGVMLFYFYKKIAGAVFIWLWLISGFWLWIGGRNSTAESTYHIGASTLVYALASFLFFSGLFRRHIRLMVVSLLVVFLYGGIVWGIFPLKQEISWEGHLFGAIAGILVAYNYRKEGPQRREYAWPDDNEEEELPYWEQEEQTEEADVSKNQVPDQSVKIRYIYTGKNNAKEENE